MKPLSLMEWVEFNSWRDPDTGCLIWKMGGAHGGTQPQGRFGGTTILVRRELFKATTDRPLPRVYTVKCKCDRENCVEPSHLVRKRNPGRKGQRNTVAHNKKIAEGIRAAVSSLTVGAVEDMRSKEAPREVYAEKYGIAKEHVTDIQTHRVWRDYSNPFAALL